MTDRAQIAKQASQGLIAFAKHLKSTPVLLGFDGFVDSIISVVDKRHNLKRYDPVATIEQFGKKITAAAGMSSNYEMVVQLEKLGGNGPIMANAMIAIGLPVTYIGAVGVPTIHPVFAPMAAKAKVISIANPGLTDALEFEDGKLMLGKYGWLGDVQWKSLEKAIGKDKLTQLIGAAKFLGMVNWTMMPGVSDVLAHLTTALPKISKQRKTIFIDLADPEKRTLDDLRDVLKIGGKLQKAADVMLGLNLKEATQVAAVLGIEAGQDPEAGIQTLAVAIREKLGVQTVVIHPRKSAAAATLVDGQVRSAHFQGPFVAKPKLSTGAGDNFNAGFCLGVLAGLPLEQCLCVGTATSGYYVRNAGSPTLAQLARFCAKLPAPQ